MRTLSAFIAAVIALTFATGTSAPAVAADTQKLDRDSRAALKTLYEKVPSTKALGQKATAILVFPRIVKAGLGVGGQTGDGVLLMKGKTAGYYNSTGVSSGIQAGVQRFGYALFLMNEAALKYINDSDGWEVGVGPSIVVMDEGKAKTTTTTTAKSDVYAFIFKQEGLMAGAGLQGTKITRLKP